MGVEGGFAGVRVSLLQSSGDELLSDPPPQEISRRAKDKI